VTISPPEAAIGRYELLTRLAVGGMAEIFLALEHGLGGMERTVVIKRILPQLADNAHFVEMFLREARIIARLNHPNVVHIHELGETVDGTPFIAMEYVGGSTARELQVLAERAGESLPLGVAAGIVAQAARGLHAAHELTDREGRPLGIIHRDISPHNLMVTEEGHVKLLDFGIAKATQGDDATYSGALKGKFSYLSPEQVDKQRLDRRSDIFALGIVLWELATGRRLFKRASELEMIEAVRHDEVPPPSRFNRDVPRWIDVVTVKALARDREARYASADELRRALERAADESLLDFGADAVGTFVRRIAGATLAERRVTLQRAREQTLVSSERRRLLPGSTSSSGSGQGGETTLDEPGTAVERLAPTAGGPEENAGRGRGLRRWRRPALVALGAAVVVVGLALWSPWEGRDGSERAPAFVRARVFEGEPLPVGWPPYVDRELVIAELEPFQDYLQSWLERPMPFEVCDTYADCAERLGRGELAFAALPPLLYVTTADALEGLELLAIKEYDGAHSYAGWLMVRDDVGVSRLGELEGRTFCYTDENSTSGYFLPRQYLREQGYDPDRFVGRVHWSGQHLQALRDVLSGRCDVVATYNGAVYSASDEGVGVGRLHLVATTGVIPQDAMVAAPHVPPETRARFREALLAFDPEAHTGEPYVGAVQRITGFQPAEDGLYDALRRASNGAGPSDSGVPPFPP
jgi:eukaryotic-like serine/threonine-protein kinase